MISNDRFVIDVEGNQILGIIIAMEKCCYIWISNDGVPPVMDNLVTSIPTRFDTMPLASTLISSNNESDYTLSLSSRISKRYSIQVFMSCNLPSEFANLREFEMKLNSLLDRKFERTCGQLC